MSVKSLVLLQYRELIDRAQKIHSSTPPRPPEGWLRTSRKALGMSAAALSRRLGYTRSRIIQIERAENSGGLTLRTMERVAAAMGCKFIYAVVPEQPIDQVIESRARALASSKMASAGIQMALVGQSLTLEASAREINRLVTELIVKPGPDFWDD